MVPAEEESWLKPYSPFAQAASIAHQSAFDNSAEACHLLHEIVLGHIKEQVTNVDCCFWFREAFAS